MGRRRSKSEGSLDSLLDTMTNVVGILVIVLAVTQLSVGEAVKRIVASAAGLEEPPEVPESIDPEELERRRQQMAQADQRLQELQRDLLDVEPMANQADQELAQLDRRILQAQSDLEQMDEAMVDPEALKKLLEQRKKKVEELEAKILAANDDIARIKALLEEKPEEGPSEGPAIVTLPDPRPAPEDAKAVHIVCRGGRLLPCDLDSLRRGTNRAAEALLATPAVKTCEDLVEVFNRRNIGDRFFRCQLRLTSSRLQLILEPRPNVGEPLEQVQRRASNFARLVRTMNPKAQYLRFMVWSDSFDVYLAAREQTDEIGMPAGWQPFSENANWVMNLSSSVKCQTEDGNPIPRPSSPSPSPQPSRPSLPPTQID